MSIARRTLGISLGIAMALGMAACARSESAQDASVSVAAGIDKQSREWDAAEQKAGRPAAARRGPEATPTSEPTEAAEPATDAAIAAEAEPAAPAQ